MKIVNLEKLNYDCHEKNYSGGTDKILEKGVLEDGAIIKHIINQAGSHLITVCVGTLEEGSNQFDYESEEDAVFAYEEAIHRHCSINGLEDERNLAVLRFNETDIITKEHSEELLCLVETYLSDTCLSLITTKVANIKQAADHGDSLANFDIPKEWNSYSWKQKVKTIGEHIADTTDYFTVFRWEPAIEQDIY